MVLRPIATASLMAVGSWWSCRWLPGKPALTPALREMVKFGLNITGFTLMDFVARSVDRVAIGYFQGARNLGYYQNAQLVYTNALEVLALPLHGVAVSSLSKLRDNVDELRRSWANALCVFSFYSMPIFGILAVTGQDVLVILLGAKWLSAGTLLSVLALRGMANAVERTVGWLHVAAGRADRWMRWGVVSCLAQVVALGCGLPFGTMGVVVAYSVAMYILFIPAIAYSGGPFGIRFSDVTKVVMPPLVGALCAAAAGFMTSYYVLANHQILIRIPLLGLIYLAVYVLIVVFLFKVRKPIHVALSLTKGVSLRQLGKKMTGR